MGKRENRLEESEKQQQRKFRLGVAVLFLNTQSNNDLYQNLSTINRDIRGLLQDVEGEAIDEAAIDTEEFTDFVAKPTKVSMEFGSRLLTVINLYRL